MAPFFRPFFSANYRYFRYPFFAASKNNRSNSKSSLGITCKALPTLTSILSERPASDIFFLAISAIDLSNSIVTSFPIYQDNLTQNFGSRHSITFFPLLIIIDTLIEDIRNYTLIQG
jgi:hypothetical protein